jgi:hypothetical protein
MEDPVVGRSYFYIAHRDLCEPCKDELEFNIKPTVRTKDPFSYEWYDKLVQESIEKAIQKGKF